MCVGRRIFPFSYRLHNRRHNKAVAFLHAHGGTHLIPLREKRWAWKFKVQTSKSILKLNSELEFARNANSVLKIRYRIFRSLNFFFSPQIKNYFLFIVHEIFHTQELGKKHSYPSTAFDVALHHNEIKIYINRNIKWIASCSIRNQINHQEFQKQYT